MAKNSSPSVGLQIRVARKSTGLTLDDLGQQIGISAQALSAIERGNANPSRQTLINLARALENDFGEAWLRKYATGSRRLTHRQIVEKALIDQEVVRQPRDLSWDDFIWDWIQEAQEAANLPHPVKLFNQKSALIPIHYEVADGTTLIEYEGSDKVSVPYSIIPSIEEARCIRVHGSPIRNAFVCPGDILVLREVSIPEEDKIVLALVDNRVVIGNWKLIGRKVMFTPVDPDCESLLIPRKKVEFVGQLMGVLRFVSVTFTNNKVLP